MHALIERLWREHRFTALLVTHDVQEAVALGDRIVLIEEGRIALDAADRRSRGRARVRRPRSRRWRNAVLQAGARQCCAGESVRDEAASQEVHPLSIRWAV